MWREGRGERRGEGEGDSLTYINCRTDRSPNRSEMIISSLSIISKMASASSMSVRRTKMSCSCSIMFCWWVWGTVCNAVNITTAITGDSRIQCDENHIVMS
eukprot:TRINITY_DN1134_c0_g2_i1.p1 TRINITY_DN1134_c0_g2~~TRINITY_DN1134_c0_g2_i1.p1  ORF type:complete len:101 (-),score=13.20 TRINITY_DN1134_c0_g2_i1:67-369(-)